MEKVIHKLINKFTEGVDTYTHNGSTWLIFTESKQWVIELTDGKTLWYNYNFFKGIFSYTSMDVVENQQYITKWVEDNIINKVKDTRLEINITEGEVDDIIQDGVKETIELMNELPNRVKKIIKKGVKLTQFNDNENKSWIEGVIKKGVKLTLNTEYMPTSMVEDIIQSGVRKTLWISVERESLVEKTINNGVKETNPVDVMKFFDNKMEDALQNGVKETKQKKNALLILDTSGRELILESHLVVRDGVKSSTPRQYVGEDIIDKIINKSITDTIECDWDVPTDLIKDVISEGVKETHDDVYHHKGRIDGVIKNGVKETKTPGNGDITSYVEWMKENKNTSFEKLIDDVVENGEKINGTYAGGQRQSIKCKSVVEYGTKNPAD